MVLLSLLTFNILTAPSNRPKHIYKKNVGGKGDVYLFFFQIDKVGNCLPSFRKMKDHALAPRSAIREKRLFGIVY
jgi:hypothetical protein